MSWSQEKLTWPRDAILEAIKDHKSRGVPIQKLRGGWIQKNFGKYPELSRAYLANRHHHYFSKWDDALAEAGTGIESIKKTRAGKEKRTKKAKAATENQARRQKRRIIEPDRHPREYRNQI